MMSSSLGGTSGFNRTAGTGARFRMASKMTAELSPRNGKSPGRHLVQHRSKREQIGARVQFFRPRLLRRHVGDRAERRPGTGQMLRVHRIRLRVKRRNSARRTACETDLRQPEIQNLGVSALGDKDVGGLDVAVDDAFGVGRIERVGNLDGQRQNQSRFPSAGPRCGASASAHPETPWR